MSNANPGDPLDHKGLIREAYRIEGLTLEEARSIFLDWALNLPLGQDQQAAAADLLARYGADQPDNPMSAVLEEANTPTSLAKRRGGWRGRRPEEAS